MMKNLHNKILCIILLNFSWGCVAQGATCSPQNAEAADEMVDKINNWVDVEYTFKQFEGCDDGSIAEGNSEAIARLLVDKWNTLPLLSKLIQKTPRLKMFVLRHVNTTLDTDDLEKIEKFSLSACPKDMSSLCRDLNKAAIHAIKTNTPDLIAGSK